jgi:proteasome lid subunit RPN8/RPN11
MATAAIALGIVLALARGQATDLACEAPVVRQAWQLLRLSGFGHESQEHAAFIVRDEGGAYRFVYWPYNHQFLRASYQGSLDANVVAIIHTHPNSAPYPSPDDARAAESLGLPVYVVTRLTISRTLGKKSKTIWFGDWNPENDHANVRSTCR